jgi:hypothetical protein
MKKNFVLFALFCSVLFAACKENTSVTMTYHLTQCADLWMQDTSYNSNKERVLKQFLVTRGITVNTLSIATDCGMSAVCLACTCKGCDKATVEVDELNVAAMEALGFRR